MCPCTWFQVYGPSFPNLPQCQSTCETGITWPTDSLDTRVRSHLMQNNKLKALDYFLCEPPHDLGVFGSFFLKLPLMPKYLKNRYNSILRRTWQKSKASFVVKLKTSDYFRCIPPHDFGYLGPVFPNLPDVQIP